MKPHWALGWGYGGEQDQQGPRLAGILFWGGWETERGEKFGHLRWHSPGEELKPGGSRVHEWGEAL